MTIFFSLLVLLISLDSGTGTRRGAHGTIQGSAKCDKSAVSNLSLPVSGISVDSGTGTIRGAHGTPIKGANLIIVWILKSLKKQGNTLIL